MGLKISDKIAPGSRRDTAIAATVDTANGTIAEAFITFTDADSNTGTDLEMGNVQRGGVAQFWNTDTGETATITMYICLKETPGNLASGDWAEYDSISLTAPGTDYIAWSKPYRHVAFTQAFSAGVTGKLNGVVEVLF